MSSEHGGKVLCSFIDLPGILLFRLGIGGRGCPGGEAGAWWGKRRMSAAARGGYLGLPDGWWRWRFDCGVEECPFLAPADTGGERGSGRRAGEVL